MVNIKEFLDDFAEKFGKDEKEKEIIREADRFAIDYTDGVFVIYDSSRQNDKDYNYGYHGGSNGSIFKDEDYRYLWDNLISKNIDFTSWLKEHNFTEEDMMVLSGEFYPFFDIVPSFYFYDNRF